MPEIRSKNANRTFMASSKPRGRLGVEAGVDAVDGGGGGKFRRSGGAC
jgi:hypothetical protein